MKGRIESEKRSNAMISYQRTVSEKSTFARKWLIVRERCEHPDNDNIINDLSRRSYSVDPI